MTSVRCAAAAILFLTVGARHAVPAPGGASPAPTPAVAAAAQNPEVMLPAESAAKAKAITQKSIQALGGAAYLGVHDSTCSGRYALFDRKGELGGYDRFIEYVKYPDKDRTEYSKKRNIINVYNGDRGWTMDRGGVQDLPADSIESYQEGLKRDIDLLLRTRLNEEGLVFRYGGGDIVDLKQVDWVEISSRDQTTFRIAIDRSTSLPIRAEIVTRDPRTRQREVDTYIFSNYQTVQGVVTPLQVARRRNEYKVYQVFLEQCQYNTGLADSLFTRESLEQRFGELNKGKKK
jgi:hypothetical protein